MVTTVGMEDSGKEEINQEMMSGQKGDPGVGPPIREANLGREGKPGKDPPMTEMNH